MRQEFNNINPNKLHDELISKGIVPILVESDIKDKEYIAENTWITFADDVDTTKIDEVIKKHDPSQIVVPTQDEILRAKIIKDGVTMQLKQMKQDQINANLLAQIAKLGGTQ